MEWSDAFYISQSFLGTYLKFNIILLMALAAMGNSNQE